jgi:hypothetical protein
LIYTGIEAAPVLCTTVNSHAALFDQLQKFDHANNVRSLVQELRLL